MSDFQSLFQKRATAENNKITMETNRLIQGQSESRETANSSQEAIKAMFASREKKTVVSTAMGAYAIGHEPGRRKQASCLT